MPPMTDQRRTLTAGERKEAEEGYRQEKKNEKVSVKFHQGLTLHVQKCEDQRAFCH